MAKRALPRYASYDPSDPSGIQIKLPNKNVKETKHMNKIIITGRLTSDPELKASSTGTELCNFTVAVDRRVKKDAEKKTDFFACTAFNKSASFIEHYFKKGDGITVDGRMESRKWADSDGNNRLSWGITVENVEFPLSNRKGDTATGELTEDTSTDDLPF